MAPQEAIVRKEEDEWVHRALHGLRPQQRAVLVLREFEGLSYKEIAGLVGCPVGTVMSRLFAARKNLKAALEEVI